MKRAVISLMVLSLLVLAVGCVLFRPRIEITANPTSGVPSFQDGGLLVTIKIENLGPKGGKIDFGDGDWETMVGRVVAQHLYKMVGTYRITLTPTGGMPVLGPMVMVENDPCPLYPPFFVECFIQERMAVALDGRRSEHGCVSSGSAERFGAWPRAGEELTYHWQVEQSCGPTVYGDGEIVAWHVCEEDPPIFPDDVPVLTPYGTWWPQGCPAPEPPEPTTPPSDSMGAAMISLTVVNQFGSTAAVERTVAIYGAGCGCR